MILNGARAHFVGEVGRRRQGAAMVVNRPQPARRLGQETERRHHHQRKGVVQAAQAGADQAHVVIQRQPTDEHVVGTGGNVGPWRAGWPTGWHGSASPPWDRRCCRRCIAGRRDRWRAPRRRSTSPTCCNSATVTMWRSSSTWDWSSRATRFASGTVISATVWALFNNWAWRRRCSSSCEGRTGGRSAPAPTGQQDAEEAEEVVGAGGQHQGHSLARL